MKFYGYYSEEYYDEMMGFLMINSKKQLKKCPFNDHGYIWSLGEFLYLTRYLRLENMPKLKAFNSPEWKRICIFIIFI